MRTNFLGSIKFLYFISIGTLASVITYENALACGCCESYQTTGFPEWDTLNMRSSPGTGYDVVRQFEYLDCGIEMLGPKQGNWVKVRQGDDVGWVNRIYLKWKR